MGESATVMLRYGGGLAYLIGSFLFSSNNHRFINAAEIESTRKFPADGFMWDSYSY